MNPITSRAKCMGLLARCVDLFQPDNHRLYAQVSAEGKLISIYKDTLQVPGGFPQDFQQLYDFSGKIYSAMLALELPEENLACPNFEEMLLRLDGLTFEECAQFLLFYNRANLRYGQDFFFKIWRDGAALRVVRRMLATAGDFQFPEERKPPHYEPASIELVTGDICSLHVENIVNPTDERFSGSGGIDRLIHSKAGPELRSACEAIGGLPVGQAVFTQGFELPSYILHTSVPGKNQENAGYLLASCYVNCLERAKDSSSVAFPALGSGSVGFAPEEALRIAAFTVWHWCQKNPGPLRTVTFVFTSEEKKLLMRKYLIECVVEEFARLVSPERLAVSLRHTLPWFFEECGGLHTLSPEKESQATPHREAYRQLHHRYSDLMLQMYQWIGQPHYIEVVSQALTRNGCSTNDFTSDFMKHLPGMTPEECICYIVMLQRSDYASGGTAATHLKHCANGNVYRVLEHMRQLLQRN